MSPIRRTLIAGLWGVPGPVFASAIGITVVITCWNWPARVQVIEDRAVRTANQWCEVLAAEAAAGFLFGAFRCALTARDDARSLPSPWRGASVGAVIWTLLALPVVCMGSLLALYAFSRGLRWPAVLMAVVAVAHALGGAIAGFHVDYFLLRELRGLQRIRDPEASDR